MNRYVIQAQPHIHQGATIQRTDPVPAVSQPNYYRPDVNRYMWEGPEQLFDGSSAPVVPHFPVNIGQPKAVVLRQQPAPPVQVQGATSQQSLPALATPANPNSPQVRQQPQSVPQFQGATVQQTDIFNGGGITPIVSRPIMVASPGAEIHQAATSQQTYVFPNGLPELRAYAGLNRNRFIVDAPKRIDDGSATVQPQTYLFPVSQPDSARVSVFTQQNRFIVDAPKRLDGATSQQAYIFPVSQPEPTRVLPVGLRYLVDAPKYSDGAVIFAPASFIFPPNQPELRWWNIMDPNRRPVEGPQPQLQGATSQAWFIYPLDQPWRALWERQAQQQRYLVGVVPQLQGATDQQTYLFPLSQPVLVPPRQIHEARKMFEGFTQSFVFPLSQPTLGQRQVQLPATQRIDVLVQPQTYIFPVSQPTPGRRPTHPTWTLSFFEGLISVSVIRPVGFAVSATPIGTMSSGAPTGTVS